MQLSKQEVFSELAKLNSFCGVVEFLYPWVVFHISLGGGSSNSGSRLIVVADFLVSSSCSSYNTHRTSTYNLY